MDIDQRCKRLRNNVDVLHVSALRIEGCVHPWDRGPISVPHRKHRALHVIPRLGIHEGRIPILARPNPLFIRAKHREDVGVRTVRHELELSPFARGSRCVAAMQVINEQRNADRQCDRNDDEHFHDFSFRRWLSPARSLSPYIRLSSSISFTELDEKAALPSKACSTMPSSRSPKVRSFNSAKAFRTFRMRFSMRTPVCTRSISSRSAACVFMVLMYLGTKPK